MMRFVLSVALWCWSVMAFATHILGGEMFYDKLGGDDHRITLKLYRDCGPGNINGTGFDFSAFFVVYNGAGLYQFTRTVPMAQAGEQMLELDVSNPCLVPPPSACASWVQYSTVITLPPNASGYVISYQRCCRTPSMTNLPSGLLQGLTCTAQIPPASEGSNSSPRFTHMPSVVLCLGEDLEFDHSAVDPDGDELVYDLYTPFAGGSEGDPVPEGTEVPPPPYAPIVWASGYSAADPMDGLPGVAIDPTTGLFTVRPTLIGSFTVGVRVREYRNGTFLGETIRDVRMDVTPCDANTVSSIQDQEAFCAGMTVFMQNESLNGDSYAWDFGVPGVDNDTSSLVEPFWTYADTGTYTIRLIANPGLTCADTSWSSYAVQMPLAPHFERPLVRCPLHEVVLNATGTFSEAALLSWDLGDLATPQNAIGQGVSVSFLEAGTHAVTVTVQEMGCTETFTDSVVVRPPLDPFFERPPIRCPLEETLLSVTGAFDGTATAQWDFGDQASPIGGTGLTTTASFLQAGTYAVRVNVQFATCEGSFTDSVVVYPPPVVQASDPLAGCIGVPLAFSALGTALTPTRLTWAFGDGNVAAGDLVTHAYADDGWYDVTVSVQTDEGCIASRSLVLPAYVEVYPDPVAAFTVTPDQATLMEPEIVVEDHAVGAVQWSYFLDGSFVSAEPSFVHEFLDAGTYLFTQHVVSATACASEVSRVVVVKDHLVYAPTAFTPDGDGVNDAFLPSVRGARLYELVIVDRWGRECFRTTDAKAGWNGDGYSQGVYNYTIRIAEYGAYSKEYQGQVSLLR